jgi:protein-disulfide isomerase
MDFSRAPDIVHGELPMMRLRLTPTKLGMPFLRTLIFFGGIVGLACVVLWPLRPSKYSPSPDAQQTVVASVGAHQITLKELEQAAALSLYQVDQQRNTLLRKALQDMVDEELLRGEATRKGLTVDQLLEEASQSTDIARLANLPAPVRRVNPAATPGRSAHTSSQDLQEQARIRQALLVSLRRHAQIQITLQQPPLPVLSVSPDDDPSIGPSDAPITIIEFSDFQCSYCKLSVPVIKELLQQYPETVKVVYRDYPGPNHPYAAPAAEAAQCAADQGQFWQYHDLLFSRQVSGSGWDFAALAEELKLDAATFISCLDTGRYREEVSKDLQDGLKLSISSTPTFFVNGRPLVGAHPLADFKALIDPLLKH